MDSWMKSYPGKRFTIYDLPAVAYNALINAATPRNILNGFLCLEYGHSIEMLLQMMNMHNQLLQT